MHLMYQTLQTANAILEIKSVEETSFDEALSGPKLTKGRFVLSYQGDLEGEGILEELKVHFSAKNAVMQGLQRFKGKLDGRTGSFILKQVGRYVNGALSSKLALVPASATDGLKGLRGEMNLRNISPTQFAVTFNYHYA